MSITGPVAMVTIGLIGAAYLAASIGTQRNVSFALGLMMGAIGAVVIIAALQ